MYDVLPSGNYHIDTKINEIAIALMRWALVLVNCFHD